MIPYSVNSPMFFARKPRASGDDPMTFAGVTP